MVVAVLITCACLCKCTVACDPSVHMCRVGQHHIYTVCIRRVGQNRIYTPYMTVYLAIFLPKFPYIHRIYMVLANPMYTALLAGK